MDLGAVGLTVPVPVIEIVIESTEHDARVGVQLTCDAASINRFVDWRACAVTPRKRPDGIAAVQVVDRLEDQAIVRECIHARPASTADNWRSKRLAEPALNLRTWPILPRIDRSAMGSATLSTVRSA